MTSQFMQRQIDRLLQQAEEALDRLDWAEVKARAGAVLRLDPANADAQALLAAANVDAPATPAAAPPPQAAVTPNPAPAPVAPPEPRTAAPAPVPATFANGRYVVKRFLGEGGKKKVYLAHDSLLDRDVAFALIKAEGLDAVGRERVTREAQAMGRLGAHPHIVSVFDLGGHDGQPFMVTELMGGGDVEGAIEKAPAHRVPLDRALEIAIETCRGLEFAHSKGIVHRDLKPGNVWLTADGVAKIGDFGLAVATDRSRLTQMGMMVGTVNYMPPEQATGGEVTPRSDLYSLGAMLYELVTGRPPYVGDDTIAIIGQHVNAQLTPPAQHRNDLPSTLNALVVRLLEKDPARRPASATETLQALEAIRAGKEPAVEAGAAADTDLFRHPFVGRQPELAQLRTAFDAVLAGQGGLAMVVGEPGIGKTTLCDQLMAHVTASHGRVLVGHCYEGSASMAQYLPFVEALRSYVGAREADALRTEAGAGAAAIAAIVPELRDKLHIDPPPGNITTTDEGRWQINQAVTSFIRNAAANQPLLLLLEDLHWADRGTLDQLLQLCRSLGGTRLLVVGTYRDVEVDRSHPLSGALGELRRLGTFLRVPLRGLSIDQVQAVLEATWGPGVPHKVAETVHRETEGNPLFVQEVLRHLAERGLKPADIADDLGERVPLGVPEGVRDIVGKRLSGLSARGNQLLGIAAVLGREFRLELLQKVSGATEDEIVDALEEASERGIVEERSAVGAGITYRFKQAFFRELLYDEMSMPRRVRLHQQAGRTLEQIYGRRLDEHAAELAEHFQHSPDPNDLRKALEYCETAARRALEAHQYREAALLFEHAIAVQQALDPDPSTGSGQADAKRCDLWIAVGAAQVTAGEVLRALNGAMEDAYKITVQRREAARSMRVCVLAITALGMNYGTAAQGTAPMRTWLDRAQDAMAGGAQETAAIVSRKSGRLMSEGRYAEAAAERQRSITLAQTQNDQTYLGLAGGAQPSVRTPASWKGMEALAQALRQLDLGALDAPASCVVRVGLADYALATGNRSEADRILVALTRTIGHSPERVGVTRWQPMEAIYKAFYQGDLGEAVRLAVDPEFEPGASYASLAATLTTLVYLGRYADAKTLISGESMSGWGVGQHWMRLLPFALSGQTEDTVTSLDLLLAGLGPDDLGYVPGLFLMSGLAAATAVGHRSAAEALSRALAPLTETTAGFGATAVGRLLGDAARLLDDDAAALGHYQTALRVAEAAGCKPEIALVRLALAELLLDGDPAERPAALAHLDAAIAGLREFRMRPALERALGRRELLKA